jgi:hypothetical protein
MQITGNSSAALVGPLAWTFEHPVCVVRTPSQGRAHGIGEIELPIAVRMGTGELEKRPCWRM